MLDFLEARSRKATANESLRRQDAKDHDALTRLWTVYNDIFVVPPGSFGNQVIVRRRCGVRERQRRDLDDNFSV